MRRSIVLHLIVAAVLGLTGSQVHVPAAGALPSSLQPSDASPVATPVGDGLSCGGPGFHPIVHEGVTASDLEAAGFSGMPIIPSREMTIEAANGTPITLPAGRWSPAGESGLVFVDNEDSTTGISLVTGESWTFNESSQASGFHYEALGPWLVGATEDTSTDFWIVNPDTGTFLLTSEVFGAQFTEARTPVSWNQGGVSDSTPVVIAFTADGGNGASSTLVLPSSDPADAWVLGSGDTDAALNGAMTADGSRLVLVDPSGEIRVLDGFTGEHIASYPISEPGPTTRAIGFGSNGTTLLLLGNQRAWTIDIDTGETATLHDPDVTVPSIVFDPTTGTALATINDTEAVQHIWLDPASGEVTELDVEVLEHLPRPQHGWALLQMRDGSAAAYVLLDMATGEIVTDPIRVNGDAPSASLFQNGTEDGIWIVPGQPGQLLVFDGSGSRAFELPPLPEEIWTGWGGPSHGITPDGACVIYSLLGSGFEDPPGISWIAPLEPGAEWTEVPFEINGWLEVPDE